MRSSSKQLKLNANVVTAISLCGHNLVLRCIGSTQHLKNKFGQGYVLEIKLKANREDGDDALNVFVAKVSRASVPTTPYQCA